MNSKFFRATDYDQSMPISEHDLYDCVNEARLLSAGTCNYDQSLMGENSLSSDTTAEADGDLHASGSTARARTRFL